MLSQRLLLAAIFSSSMFIACGGPAEAPPVGESADELSRARFKNLRSGPTNADLESFYRAADKIDHAYLGAYRFNKPTTEATAPEAREKRIKEVMHRYMCTLFDDSIDIGRNRGTAVQKADWVLRDLRMDDNAYEQDDAVADFKTALERVYENEDLDVLSGGASGNNTLGEVMGIYDTVNHEIVYFGFTNCGRDD